MVITVDQAADEPLYLQIRDQVVAGIATGEIVAGQGLPSVRSLASDLGINLHTVNKAYAVLRDEGYVLMRGRKGAVVADPDLGMAASAATAAQAALEKTLYELALGLRARGGTLQQYLDAAARQAARAFGCGEPAAAPPAAASPAASTSSDAVTPPVASAPSNASTSSDAAPSALAASSAASAEPSVASPSATA